MPEPTSQPPGTAATGTVDDYVRPHERIQNRLRRDGAVEFEGMWLRYEGETDAMSPGDTYAAERNLGPQLLTVREVAPTLGDQQQWIGCVFAVENAYPYDLGECVKVSIHDADPRPAPEAIR